MPAQVRAATPADAHAIAVVYIAAWQAGYAPYFPTAYLAGLDVARARQRWSAALDPTSPASVLVATIDGRVTGVAQVGSSRDADRVGWGELQLIYVAPWAWGNGSGRALIEAARLSLRQRGFADAHLWVLDGNVRAERFYTRDGWRRDGATKVDDRRGFVIPEVRMARSLVEEGGRGQRAAR